MSSDNDSSTNFDNQTVYPNIPPTASNFTVSKNQQHQQSNIANYPNFQVNNQSFYPWNNTTINRNFVIPPVFINNIPFNPYVVQQNSVQGDSSNTFNNTQNNGQHTDTVKKISHYHAIEISGTFKIILNTDGPETVKLTADQPQLLSSVKTNAENGTLKLTMNNSGSNIISSNSSIIVINNTTYSSNNLTGTVTAHISGARQITRLTILGSSSIVSQDTLTADSFKLVLGGSSSFHGPFNVKKLNIDSSGCSKTSFSGAAETLKISISGNSSCTAMKLVSKNVHIETSGSSNVELQGSADFLTLSASGSSSCAASNFTVKTIQANTSGSSSARFHCTETLESSTHGVSSIQYRGTAKVLKGSARKIS